MRTNVYVDAFNLYYGCLRGTPYRWLDLAALCRRLLPNDEINRSVTSPHLSVRVPTIPRNRSANSPIFALYGPSPI
jgi:hypothetical protein